MADGEIMKRPDPSASLDGAGAIAASVFTRFDRGMPPDEVVTELVLPVDTVESLWRTWARLRGAVLLSARAGQALREASCSHQPITSGGDAVAAVRRFVERPSKPCTRCKSGFREYCTTCPEREPAREARGRLRGSNKKRLPRGNPSVFHRAVEPAPARGGGVLSDAVADVEAGLIDAPAPHSRPVEKLQ